MINYLVNFVHDMKLYIIVNLSVTSNYHIFLPRWRTESMFSYGHTGCVHRSIAVRQCCKYGAKFYTNY